MTTTVNTLIKPTILATETGSIALFRSSEHLDMLEVHRISDDAKGDTKLGLVFVCMPGFSMLGDRVNSNEHTVLQRHFDEVNMLRSINVSADALDDWAKQLAKLGLMAQERRDELHKCAKNLRGILHDHAYKLKIFAPVPYEMSHVREPAEAAPMVFSDEDRPGWEAAEGEQFLPYIEEELANGPSAQVQPPQGVPYWIDKAKKALTGGRHE